MSRIIGYKPLVVADIGASSVMVLPPVVPKSTDVGSWVTLTAVARDEIIEGSNGVKYWCVVAGDTGAAEPTHTDGDAADGTVTWRVVRPVRNVLSLVNSGSVEITLARGNAAEAGKGIILTGNGSAVNEGFSGPTPYQGAWYAIAASGAANELAIAEG